MFTDACIQVCKQRLFETTLSPDVTAVEPCNGSMNSSIDASAHHPHLTDHLESISPGEQQGRQLLIIFICLFNSLLLYHMLLFYYRIHSKTEI